MTTLLALETSCDDTCASVVRDNQIASNVISSQASFHEAFGGVVPEVASRHHIELVNGVVGAALDQAGLGLDDLDAIAVTRGPGLIGALLVGFTTAKSLAAAKRLPLIPVDHLQGHVAANFFEPDPLEPPFCCLIASGGHTLLAGVTTYDGYEILGSTLDDAAGEAFDKAARLLDLGYPGGPAIQKAAESGDPEAYDLPVSRPDSGRLDFSFSGLKTALAYLVRDLGPEETQSRRADLAASFQRAAVDQLIDRMRVAVADGRWRAVALGGGVAANSELRNRTSDLCEEHGLDLKLVPIELCTDNAAMIASAARSVEPIPYPEYLSLDAFAEKVR